MDRIHPIKSFDWILGRRTPYAQGMVVTEMAESSNASVLHRVSGIVSSPLSLDEMLGEIVGLAARVTSCDACLVYLAEADTGEFVLRASLLPHVSDLGNLRVKIFPTLVEDTYQAFLSVPLVTKGKAIGVINIHHRDKHEHEPEEIATISFIGEQMGSAIAKSLLEEENARLSEETAEMKRQLETRKSVERAKGILQRRHSLTEEEAYLRMRNESRRLRRPMKDLADAIILSEE